MNINPSIDLAFDKMNDAGPRPCTPYVWIVLKDDRSECAVCCDIYTSEEASRKLQEFLNDAGMPQQSTVYEATDCITHDIYGEDAVDAITMAFLKYFESETCIAENTFYEAPFDVDFSIKIAWNGKTYSFTLHPNGEISFAKKQNKNNVI